MNRATESLPVPPPQPSPKGEESTGGAGGKKIKRALAAGVFFALGLLERVAAPGGKVNGAFAQGHRLLDDHDLKAGEASEAGFLVQARAGGLGDHRFRRFGQGKKYADVGLTCTCRSTLAQIRFPSTWRLPDVE